MDRKRVLVVEDDFLIRLTLAEALADDGFEVLESGTAAEALACFESDGPIHLMMTDIQLPGGMDGAQLAAEVRAQWPDVPMIFMSGRPPAGAAAPRDVYIAKPYLPSDVCAAARRLTDAATEGA
jgi:CheY-like chemotaxis protein